MEGNGLNLDISPVNQRVNILVCNNLVSSTKYQFLLLLCTMFHSFKDFHIFLLKKNWCWQSETNVSIAF